MVLSVISPAGSITHTARGALSFPTRSASDDAPTAPARATSATISGARSYTTHSWPPFIRRRTILAPIFPSPTIAICIELYLRRLPRFQRLADQLLKCAEPALHIRRQRSEE